MCKLYDEQDSPKKGTCLRYMINRNRQRRGRVCYICELESPSEGCVQGSSLLSFFLSFFRPSLLSFYCLFLSFVLLSCVSSLLSASCLLSFFRPSFLPSFLPSILSFFRPFFLPFFMSFRLSFAPLLTCLSLRLPYNTTKTRKTAPK